MKKFFFLIFIILTIFSVQAQIKEGEVEKLEVSNIIPTEPSVSKFATYGNNSLNLFSCIPNIWQIKQGNISVPI